MATGDSGHSRPSEANTLSPDPSASHAEARLRPLEFHARCAWIPWRRAVTHVLGAVHVVSQRLGRLFRVLPPYPRVVCSTSYAHHRDDSGPQRVFPPLPQGLVRCTRGVSPPAEPHSHCVAPRGQRLGLPQKKAPADLLRATKRVQGRLAAVNKDCPSRSFQLCLWTP